MRLHHRRKALRLKHRRMIIKILLFLLMYANNECITKTFYISSSLYTMATPQHYGPRQQQHQQDPNSCKHLCGRVTAPTNQCLNTCAQHTTDIDVFNIISTAETFIEPHFEDISFTYNAAPAATKVVASAAQCQMRQTNSCHNISLSICVDVQQHNKSEQNARQHVCARGFVGKPNKHVHNKSRNIQTCTGKNTEGPRTSTCNRTTTRTDVRFGQLLDVATDGPRRGRKCPAVLAALQDNWHGRPTALWEYGVS